MALFSFSQGAPVGLDIGTNTFRVAQLKAAPEKPVLINSGAVKIPPGVVSEGEIVDVEAASRYLADLWKGLRISEEKVVIGVANQKVVVRLVEMPRMERSELKNALRFQAQESIPIPVDEAVMDFDVVGEHMREDGERMLEVLLVAAQREMIDNHVKAVQGAGLRPVAIDVSSLALTRSLLSERISIYPGEQGREVEAVALINVSAGITNILILEDELPRFTRITSFAGNSFTEMLRDKMNLSFEDAEALKLAAGLPSLDNGAASDGQIALARSILEQEMASFISEIRRSLDYYLAQATRVRSIDRIIVSGHGAAMHNFVEHLSDGLQLEVEVGRPLAKIKVGGKLDAVEVAAEEASMAVCLGLALRGLEG